ncbi:hypothetical protein PHLCEN_2v2150 [Hermanssonia centrifuga]|uniref:Uncharacterized protein n=1 Tax=Hermanssonia centrifuga TaxID=98765 RepID=A0A2R6RPX3_9APHY|nr:hypothetical protein PHLCEN_2v2150 [Hermanssonia centrifuga]
MDENGRARQRTLDEHVSILFCNIKERKLDMTDWRNEHFHLDVVVFIHPFYRRRFGASQDRTYHPSGSRRARIEREQL